MTAAEEKQLAELTALLKKSGKLSNSELKSYDEWFRGVTPAD